MSESDSRLESLAKSSRRTAAITLASAVLVLFSLVYSGWKLHATETLLVERSRDLERLQQSLERVQREVEIQKDSLVKLKKEMSDVFAATVALRNGADRAFIRDYDRAIQYFDAALGVQPENPVLLMHKGFTQLRKGQSSGSRELTEKAVRSLQGAVKLDSSYALGHYNLALGYWALADTTNALEEVRHVMRLSPELRPTLIGDPQFYRMQKLPGFWNVVRR